MKYLTDYTELKLLALFEEQGAFRALGEEALAAQAVEGVEYGQAAFGVMCPIENCQAVRDGINKIMDEGRAADIAENGRDGVIQRELFNLEAFVSYDTTSCEEALADYGITKNEVVSVFNRVRKAKGW